MFSTCCVMYFRVQTNTIVYYSVINTINTINTLASVSQVLCNQYTRHCYFNTIQGIVINAANSIC